MEFKDIIKNTEDNMVNVFSRFPIAFTHGKGTKIYDTNGKEYIDFLSGIAVNALGFCDEELTQALKSQIEKFTHISNYFYCESQAKLLKILIEGSDFSKCFLCNSGAEANEAALKLARKHYFKKGQTKKTDFITAKYSFHGRTLMTATLTGQEKYSAPFAPLPTGVTHVEFNNLEAFKKALTKNTCAVMLEVIQGEGGINLIDKKYIQAVSKLCKENDTLLIIDEVQTGLGRLGTMFGYQNFDITPDIITLAKSFGGGLPLGAMLARGEVANSFEPGNHGSTFGGNPLACEAGYVVLKRLKETSLIKTVADTSNYFFKKLNSLTKFKFVSKPCGLGLLIGLHINEKISTRDIVGKMLDKGFIINTVSNNTLRFAPPLIITKEEIDNMISALAQVFETYK